MFELIDNILQKFRTCFNRESTFYWFCIIVFGIMIRPDFRGVTSIVGTLSLSPNSYYNMLHFFRSTAYKLENLKTCWIQIVLKLVKIKELSGYLLAVGDHCKIVKEARHMPAVKKHHQDSENSGKGEYIYGHEFGMIGMLTDSPKMQCIPADIEIHDGKDDINELTKNKESSSLETIAEHTEEIEKEVISESEKELKKKHKSQKSKKTKNKDNGKKRKTKTKNKSKKGNGKNAKKEKNTSSSANKLMNMFERLINRIERPILIVLDAGFATGNVFKKVFEINKKAEKNLAAVITRAKCNYVGCKEASEKIDKGSGRPAKYGEEVAFYSYFDDMSQFNVVNLNIYGKVEKVQYFCIDLFWKSADNIRVHVISLLQY